MFQSAHVSHTHILLGEELSQLPGGASQVCRGAHVVSHCDCSWMALPQCQAMSHFFLWLLPLTNCFLQSCCPVYQLEPDIKAWGFHPLLREGRQLQPRHHGAPVQLLALLQPGAARHRGSMAQPSVLAHPCSPRLFQLPRGPRLLWAPILVLQAGQVLDILSDLRGRKSHSVSADFLIQHNLFISRLRTA